MANGAVHAFVSRCRECRPEARSRSAPARPRPQPAPAPSPGVPLFLRPPSLEAASQSPSGSAPREPEPTTPVVAAPQEQPGPGAITATSQDQQPHCSCAEPEAGSEAIEAAGAAVAPAPVAAAPSSIESASATARPREPERSTDVFSEQPPEAGEQAPTTTAEPAEAPAAGGRAETTGTVQAAGRGAATERAAQEPAAEQQLPAEVAAESEAPLQVPPVESGALAPTWQAPDRLPEDATAAVEAGSNGGKEASQGPQKGGRREQPAGSSHEEQGESARAARLAAGRKYVEVAEHLRRQQAGFVSRAAGILRSMERDYRDRAAGLIDAHGPRLEAVDATADRALVENDGTFQLARIRLDEASGETAAAITAAGRHAYALINADDRTAARRIATVVNDLVSGHIGAYNRAVRVLERSGERARHALNSWLALRASLYPTAGQGYEDSAINESRQAHAPNLVELELQRFDEEMIGPKITIWRNSRDKTVCGLRCSYQAALEAERVRMNRQGRASVARALGQARRTLADQTRAGHRALADMRRACVDQVRTRQRATRSALTSHTRSALAAMRQEADGALRGVRGGADASQATYPTAARGFEQALRDASTRGAPALDRVASQAAARILASTQAAGRQLDARLEGNRDRLSVGLGSRRDGTDRAADVQVANAGLRFGEISTAATGRANEATSSFLAAFGGLAGTVTEAAAAWSRPLAVRLARFISTKRAEAHANLQQILTGQAPPRPAGRPAGPAEPEPDCSACDNIGAEPGGGETGGAATSHARAPSQGLIADRDTLVGQVDRRAQPVSFFEPQMAEIDRTVRDTLEHKAEAVGAAFEGGWAGTVDEKGVAAALRGLTPFKGRALEYWYYPDATGRNLEADLERFLLPFSSGADYRIARAYLRGDVRAGARLELRESLGTFNDDEARIEAVLRALSPQDLRALGHDASLVHDVGGALDGTDRRVFDALLRGEHATADALRLRDAVDSARRDGNADAVHSAIELHTAPGQADWRSVNRTPGDERAADRERAAVVDALGRIVPASEVARGAAGRDVESMSPAERAEAYVARGIDIEIGGGEAPSQTITVQLTGANRDLAAALLRHGPDAVETRAARLGVEIERHGRPNTNNIDRALYDERFQPDRPNITPEERATNEKRRQEGHRDRQRLLLLAARYAPARGTERPRAPADPAAVMRTDFEPPEADVRNAQAGLIRAIGDRYGSDDLGRQCVAGLLSEERPSAATASLVMQHAMYSRTGTNEELLTRFAERMTPEEIAAMRVQFRKDTGRSLDAELGLYGEGGIFTELSGDDRLRMERAMLGVARTDRERLQHAAFAIAQQRRETGAFGASLAEGTLADQMMSRTAHRLEVLAGGPIAVGLRGELLSRTPNFDPRSGEYRGGNRNAFLATVSVAQAVAENYSARIDAFADVATTGIAILGAIAAAVITVATGGAALPLIAAAVATGLASMAANYTIKGGRYGWEQAAIDLGMTAVQAITAGVGAQLGAAAQVASKGAAAVNQASRSLAALSRLFTGNQVLDQVIIGALTGSISGLGTTALSEATWEGRDPVGELFAGLLRGALSGAATAAVTNSVESLGGRGHSIGERLQGLVAQGGLRRAAGAMVARGLARGTISGLGGVAGKGTEIVFEAGRGRYRGDAGQALLEMGQAGLHAFVQGVGEGAGEAHGQRIHGARLQRAAEQIQTERAFRNREPLDAHAMQEAAADLLFLNQHGRNRGPIGRAINLDHVATHGGIEPTVAETRPSAFLADRMRANLMRHVPPEMHAEFADVPVRVLPEAEYRALTRSDSGPVVTRMHDGRPTVLIREGTSIARLADEGPHLVQSREAGTRERVARLDEAVLARWDTLDVDTQLELYRNKIELEIDAHQRIARSLEEEAARGGGDPRALATDRARNDGTLRSLRERLAEAEGIGPARRAAMQEGRETRPDYLDQPARLFSKEGRPREPTPEERFAADVLETMLSEIGEKRRMAARGGLVEEELQNLPEAVAAFLRRGERMPGRSEIPPGVAAHLRRVARERFGQQLREALRNPDRHNRMTLAAAEHLDEPQLSYVRATGRLPRGVEFHHLLPVADFPEFAHLAEAGTALPKAVHREAGHAGETTRPVEAATLLDPEALSRLPGLHLDPEARKFARARYREIAEGARSTRDVDRDLGIQYRQMVRRAENDVRQAEQRAQRRPGDRSERQLAQARAALETARAHLEMVDARLRLGAEMREALTRHVAADLRKEFADVPIQVLPARRYRELTRSDAGPVVTILLDGRPVVLVREGTPPSRLADEGPHLLQAREARTRERVALLDEAVLARWDSLDLDTQVALYRNKIELEIDAHQQVQRSLRGMARRGEGDAAELRAEQQRNNGTLRSLRERLAEVTALGPNERAAIRADPTRRPQYLDQPARLFSKERAPAGGRPRGALPESEAVQAARQRLEGWTETVRRGYLEPGRMPPMAETPERTSPRGYPWHASVEEAYATYDALMRETGGRVEAGIVFDAQTGEYVVVRGDPLRLKMTGEAARPETVLHYHPDYGPAIHRGPSMTDLLNARDAARAAGHPVTQFIEYGAGGQNRGRTAFTVTRIPVEGEPGRFRMQIDLEFINPTNGERRHQRFNNLSEWHAYYSARQVAVDPAGPLYAHLLGPFLSPEQIARAAARHRLPGAAPEPAGAATTVRPAPGRTINEVVDAEGPGGPGRQATPEEAQGVRPGAERAQGQPEPGLRRRLAAVAEELHADVGDLIEVLGQFQRNVPENAEGFGRRREPGAKTAVRSLRDASGDLQNLVPKTMLEQNVAAIRMMREDLVQLRPDAVLGVDSGGAFLAEVLSRGFHDFPATKTLPVLVRLPGGEVVTRRTTHLEAEIRGRIALGQSRFAIVDSYMGGGFAGELQRMIGRVLADHPHVEFYPAWLREMHGFDRVVTGTLREALKAELRGQGGFTAPLRALALAGSEGEFERLVVPQPRRAALESERVRPLVYPVDVIVGDDMRCVKFDPMSREPIRIFDRNGRIVQEIPVGTRDPETGEPLLTTRAILLRLLQGVEFDI